LYLSFAGANRGSAKPLKERYELAKAGWRA